MAASYHQRLTDIARLKQLAESSEQLAQAERPAQFTPEFLSLIGINFQQPVAGDGYIKLLYRDFVVEEITENGEIVDVGPGSLASPEQDAPQTEDKQLRLEIELVKQGYSTFEAVERLAEVLQLNLNQITYGGLKDGRAITAQRVSINNTARERLHELQLPNVLIKNARYRLGMRNTGELLGNRFTILVRTSGLDQSLLDQRLHEIKERGFLNFYSLQRFGGRLQAHKVGKLILQGRYEDALRLFLAGSSPHEMRLLQNIREDVANNWGNWKQVAELFNQFPYFFQNELKAVRVLEQNNENITGALSAADDQTKMAINAYGSFCFNQALSLQARHNQISESIPLLTPEAVDWYQQYLPDENLKSLRWHHPHLSFLGRPRARSIPTRVTIEIHSVTPVEQGLIFHFDLSKGAYATTFLAALMNVYQGRPIPEWVNQDEIDARSLLGYPTISRTEDAFPKSETEIEELAEI